MEHLHIPSIDKFRFILILLWVAPLGIAAFVNSFDHNVCDAMIVSFVNITQYLFWQGVITMAFSLPTIFIIPLPILAPNCRFNVVYIYFQIYNCLYSIFEICWISVGAIILVDAKQCILSNKNEVGNFPLVLGASIIYPLIFVIELEYHRAKSIINSNNSSYQQIS